MVTYVTLQMKCEDCGHVQTVKGFRAEDDSYYFGSAYDFCDNCDGLPFPISEPKEVNDERT